MSDIKITPEELKGQAAQMTSLQSQYESLFRSVTSELRGMNQNWSSLLANNFMGKINSAGKGFSVIESILQTGASAALQSARTLESVDEALAKMNLDGVGGVKKGAKVGKKKSGLQNDFHSAVETQRKLNRFIEKIPERNRKIIKDFFKLATKNEKSKLHVLAGSEKAYSIWSKFADGKYVGVGGDFIEAVGGTVFESKKGTVNWTALKVQGLGKTIKLVLDEKSYLSKNAEKYEEMAADYLLKGDVTGFVGAGFGELVQTVGKGTVDILCQTAGSVLDGAVSAVTGGKFTITSINQTMYDCIGTSPGHLFNSGTKAISDGVDYVVDKGLIEGTSNITKAFGSIVSQSAAKIGSLFR